MATTKVRTTHVPSNRLGIPAPTTEAESLRQSVLALRTAVEEVTRQRGNLIHSAITVGDVISLGLVSPEAVQTLERGGSFYSLDTVAGMPVPFPSGSNTGGGSSEETGPITEEDLDQNLLDRFAGWDSLGDSFALLDAQVAQNNAAVVALQQQATTLQNTVQSNLQATIAAVNSLSAEANQLAQDAQYSFFYQTTAPVPGVGGVPSTIPTGARWYDSDDGNHAYYWDGSQWLDLQDATIGQNASDISALDVRLTTAEGDVAAAASAVSALESTVTALEGTVTSQASLLTSLEANLEGLELLTLLDTAVSSNASALQALDARVTYSEEEMTTMASDISALQVTVATIEGGQVALDAIQALESRVTVTEGSIAANTSAITNLQGDMTLAEADIVANAGALSALDIRMTAAEGDITTQASDITALDVRLTAAEGSASGNASAISALDVRVTSNEGGLSTAASDIVALETSVGGLTSTVGGHTTAINNLDTRLLTAEGTISGHASSITSLNASVALKARTFAQATQPTATAVGDIWIETDNNNKIWRWNGTSWVGLDNPAISANASAISGLDIRVSAAEGNISSQASDITSLQSTVGTLDTTVSGNSTAISGLETRVTDVEGDVSAQSSSITSLQSTLGTKARTFAQTTQPTATAIGDIWIETDNNNKLWRWNGSNWVGLDNPLVAANASAVSGLTTQVNNLDGEVSALASDVTTLDTTVGGFSSSISSLQSSVNGLSAQYAVKIDNNGFLSGFGLASTLPTDSPTKTVFSEFAVLADSFKIRHPGTSTDTIPFQVVGGVVHMQNIKVGNAEIDDLNVGKLTAGTLVAQVTQNADWEVGTGRIIFDNGAYMKVQGVGFGTSNQFIEWYGPRPTGGNINLCSEANAIYYLKTNGSAYFGGALSAGVLKNSAQTTSLASNASIELGPFGTNGSPKVVTVSYSAIATPLDSATDVSTGNAGSAVVVLERSLNGGASWTQIASGTIVGSVSCMWNGGEPGLPNYTCARSAGGSFTYTDSNTSTSNFMYRARITSRTFSFNSMIHTQSVSVISVEE